MTSITLLAARSGLSPQNPGFLVLTHRWWSRDVTSWEGANSDFNISFAKSVFRSSCSFLLGILNLLHLLGWVGTSFCISTSRFVSFLFFWRSLLQVPGGTNGEHWVTSVVVFVVSLSTVSLFVSFTLVGTPVGGACATCEGKSIALALDPRTKKGLLGPGSQCAPSTPRPPPAFPCTKDWPPRPPNAELPRPLAPPRPRMCGYFCQHCDGMCPERPQ